MSGLKYDRVLDAFSGTSTVSFHFKRLGKEVICNDLLRSSYISGRALIENGHKKLDPEKIADLSRKHLSLSYPMFVKKNFGGVYYKDHENAWLDVVTANIHSLTKGFEGDIAFHSLFQSCLAKRPFNLFHRKNLYIRTARVSRSFSNPRSWETAFPVFFARFVTEANQAVFDNGRDNKATNCDALDIRDTDFDLVYIDPPYVSLRGINKTEGYAAYYHFLDGLCDYYNWSRRVDRDSRNLRLTGLSDSWGRKFPLDQCFDRLFQQFEDSIIVVSYRSPGIPSVNRLRKMLRRYKKNVKAFYKPHQYVLTSDTQNREVLLLAT